MNTLKAAAILVADRIWIATALLHRQSPSQKDFTKAEILHKLQQEGLASDIARGTLNAHLDQHCVANVPPSTAKYRMLYETTPGGNLRLFRPGDFTCATRHQKRTPSKILPHREKLPRKYRPLLDWYDAWSNSFKENPEADAFENDPLIRLIGSGRHIWADEHADEYVNNLRRED
jgi:hypothetical protein